MTPLRLRLFLVAFVGLATAISANALYFQEAPQFAGNTIRTAPSQKQARASGDDEATAATAALPKPVRAAETPGPRQGATATQSDSLRASERSRPQSSVSKKVVRGIQRELARHGYEPGEIPGTLDIRTRLAIVAYQFDQGMAITGQPSEDLLKSLIFGAAGGIGEPKPLERFEGRPAIIAEIQDLLAKLGYGAASHGRIDERTRKAIRKFESDRDLEPSGRLHPRVLLEMVVVTGQPITAG